MTATTNNQESLMRRYLLGDLPEPEQLALEAEFFADANLLERMQEIETDLVDEYVREILPQAERQQFERHYLTTPVHKQRVAFAKELLRAANEPPLPQASRSKESFIEKLLDGLRGPRFVYAAPVLVAILLLMLGGMWIVTQKALWHQQRQRERAAEWQRRSELENQIAQQNQRNAELTAELERLRAESSKPSSEPSIFSFILLSGVRGGEQQTLKLPPGTDQIRLQMKLESNDYQRYSVSIRPVDGGQSWGPQAASATTSPGGTTVSLKIPASKFTRGDYILTLTGVNATGATEEINRYYFRISK